MCIQSAVETRDLHLADQYFADMYDGEEFDFDALMEDIETKYPTIDWSPAYDCISKEAESIAVNFEDMTDEHVLQITDEASCFISESDAATYDAANEVVVPFEEVQELAA